MSLFKSRSRASCVKPVRAAIEPLEARAYFAGVPADITVTVPGPIPSSVIAGVVVNDRIGVSVADDANRARGRVVVTLFASLDNVLSVDDAQIQPGTSAVINLAPGHHHTYNIRVKSFPQNLNGTYFILAEVTGAGVNPVTGVATSTLSIEQPFIDLADHVTKTPLNGHAGRRINVAVQVTNDGNILAKGSLAVGFSLSGTPDGASPFALGSLTRKIHLKPGHSTVLHFLVPLPLGVPTGNRYVVADIDPSNAFLDPNLANNVNTGQQPVTVS